MDLLSDLEIFYHRIPIADQRVLGYQMHPHNGINPGGGDWSNIFVVYNGSDTHQLVYLQNQMPLSVVVDHHRAEIEELYTLEPNSTITLPPFSMFVAYTVQ